MEFRYPLLPGLSSLVKGFSHMCWILPSVLEDAIVEEQGPLVPCLWWGAEVTVAVAVFWCSPGAFHHKCAFLIHARSMNQGVRPVTDGCKSPKSNSFGIWWVGLIFILKRWVSYFVLLPEIKCFWTVRTVFSRSKGSTAQLVFPHQERTFFFKASRVVGSVCSRLDKWSLFGVTFLQGKAISYVRSRKLLSPLVWTAVNWGRGQRTPWSLCDICRRCIWLNR